ncbi:unnamed protein product [Adineta ricciae]|uniref:G-protein coupled receptors family 1 profile domain-containing protein n=1 Tax=Adineta ricciae TaxID=249248 RepID=A0A815SMP2_ADIRI|nr:unnamed protein product [Adineta ricciae]CAF1490126.1 unnamed protein product [Adineta ricciae]
MSSDNNLIKLFSSILQSLHQYGGPVLMITGTISSILSLCVFSRRSLRKNPCTIYLIGTNIASLFLIYTSNLTLTLTYGYSIDLTRYNLFFCRFRAYTLYVFDVLSPSYLILASIDRVLITSRNPLTRRKSTVRRAYTCIMIVTIFWLIVHTHALILMELKTFPSGSIVCVFYSDLYLSVMSYYPLVTKVILIPSMLITLALWTIQNVGTTLRVTHPVAAQVSRVIPSRNVTKPKSKDRQLIRILLVSITTYIVFNIIQSAILIYQEVTKFYTKTYLQSRIEGFVLILSATVTSIPFCIEAYTNLIVSKTFRQEVKNIFTCK